MEILVTKDQRDRVRYIKVWVENRGASKIIKRASGAFNKTETKQPDLEISAGKAGRTLDEQVSLEKNSLINRYKDRGYKSLKALTPTKFEKLTEKEILKLLGEEVTDQQGLIKPMLAKDGSKLKSEIFQRNYLISRKLDGVRCLMTWDEKLDKVIAWSRGGKLYKKSIEHITTNPKLVKLLKARRYLILDGELYTHGVSLEVLSGLARLEKPDSKTQQLEYHIFDLALQDKKFTERLELLEKLDEYFRDEPKIKVVEHKAVFGWDEIKLNHDKFIGQGYEGAVIRDPNSFYKSGRSASWIKIKEFKDEEFEITGCTLGLRGTEDMVFDLKTKDGLAFQAKPMGSRELKEKYYKEIDKLIGKKATIKYFYLTDDGRPFLPVFKNVRANGF
jgi:ATP-dependent DNA ligase